MSSERSVLMIGLPGSGKTTFLAALWHQLESSEIPTTIKAGRLQPEREYLNSIREAWLGFEEIPRTAMGMEKVAQLHLQHVRTRSEFDLSMPDVAGERYAAQWFDRQMSQSYIDQLRSSYGILLFVHCGRVTQAEVLPGGKGTQLPVTTGNIPSEWDPRHTPTQVQLVELIQTALSVFERGHVMRIAVVISAWDEVQETPTPASWLRRKLPLLEQFLQANHEVISSSIFGVSAIGGRLEDRETLALASSPSSRVRVQMGTAIVNDLTLPLEFLTVGEAAL